MKTKHLIILSIFLTGMLAFSKVEAQEKTASEIAAKTPVVEIPRGKDGKRLFGAMDLMRINGVGAPNLSPDGTKVAYTVSTVRTEKDKEWKSLTQIWVVPVAGGGPRQFTRGEKSANAPQWSPDGKHLAFLTDREKDGERQVWMMMADGGEAWAVTSHKGGVSSFRFSPDGRQLVLLATDQPGKEEEERKKVKDDTIEIGRNLKMAHLWLWDIEKKEAKRLTEGEFSVSDPQWSPDGSRVSYTTRPTPAADDGSASDIWILTIADAAKRKLTENDGPDDDARWSKDGKWIAFTGGPEPGSGVFLTRLYIVSEAGGVPKQISGKFDLNVGTPVWSEDGKMIYFSSNIRQANEIFTIDPLTGAVAQKTNLGGSISIAAVGNNGKTIIGTSTTGKRPAEIFRSNADGTGFSLITDHNAWLNEYTLADSETAKWKSKDGMDIEGVLTKPSGFQAGVRIPLLLNPHGGPTSASTNVFNGTVQVLAANGFAVLRPNFRGSTGRGLAFAQANKNTWGKGDYDDCMTGVDSLIASGLADPDRLGAFGWSYGGYMTFWILTQTDRFKAVSPGAGLSNIYSMYSQNDIQGYLRWFYSDKAPWDATDLYWDRSPMKYINNVKTPTMIMHGQVDTRVPIAQAQEFYQALKERKIPVEFIVYPRENHGFTEPRHQMDRVQRYVRFFAKYLSITVATEPEEK